MSNGGVILQRGHLEPLRLPIIPTDSHVFFVFVVFDSDLKSFFFFPTVIVSVYEFENSDTS